MYQESPPLVKYVGLTAPGVALPASSAAAKASASKFRGSTVDSGSLTRSISVSRAVSKAFAAGIAEGLAKDLRANEDKGV
jgi:hypothetical protein